MTFTSALWYGRIQLLVYSTVSCTTGYSGHFWLTGLFHYCTSGVCGQLTSGLAVYMSDYHYYMSIDAFGLFDYSTEWGYWVIELGSLSVIL